MPRMTAGAKKEIRRFMGCFDPRYLDLIETERVSRGLLLGGGFPVRYLPFTRAYGEEVGDRMITEEDAMSWGFLPAGWMPGTLEVPEFHEVGGGRTYMPDDYEKPGDKDVNGVKGVESWQNGLYLAAAVAVTCCAGPRGTVNFPRGYHRSWWSSVMSRKPRKDGR